MNTNTIAKKKRCKTTGEYIDRAGRRHDVRYHKGLGRLVDEIDCVTWDEKGKCLSSLYDDSWDLVRKVRGS